MISSHVCLPHGWGGTSRGSPGDPGAGAGSCWGGDSGVSVLFARPCLYLAGPPPFLCQAGVLKCQTGCAGENRAKGKAALGCSVISH